MTRSLKHLPLMSFGRFDQTQETCYFNLTLPKIINGINPLSPNIHIQILQTDLYKFPLRIS